MIKLKILFGTIVSINVVAIITSLSSCALVKRDGDNLLLAISMNDVNKVEKIIRSGVDVNYKYPNGDIAPITLALKTGNPQIIRILIENGADLTSLNERGYSSINYLFSDNNVETIKQVIPHINRGQYENFLSRHIVIGLNAEVNKKYRRIKVGDRQSRKEERLAKVSKYIAKELANQNNVVTALSNLCRGTFVQYIGVYNDAFEYLRPYLKTKKPEAAIGCISSQGNPIGSNQKYTIENMLSLVNKDIVNATINSSNMEKGYGYDPHSKTLTMNKSPAEEWHGSRLLDIAASRSNQIAIYYLLMNSADSSITPSQNKRNDSYKTEIVNRVNNIFNGSIKEVSEVDLQVELVRTMTIRIDTYDRQDKRTIYFERKLSKLKELGTNARHISDDGSTLIDALYWDYNDSPLKLEIALEYYFDDIQYLFSKFDDSIKREEVDLKKDYRKWEARFMAGVLLGDMYLVKSLDEKGLKKSTHNPPQIRDPLMLAYKYNQKEIFDYLSLDYRYNSYGRLAEEIESGKYDQQVYK